jgi:hypothetical protein
VSFFPESTSASDFLFVGWQAVEMLMVLLVLIHEVDLLKHMLQVWMNLVRHDWYLVIIHALNVESTITIFSTCEKAILKCLCMEGLLA